MVALTGSAAASQSTGSRAGAQSASQSSSSVSAQQIAPDQLLVQWSGDTNGVRQITLGLFDANGTMLDRRVFTQMPVRAVFTLTPEASVYGAEVRYATGATGTVYTQIR